MEVQWDHKIFSVTSHGFDALALEIFRFQAAENEVYRSFIGALNIDPMDVHEVGQIPFLPIRFFKSHRVCSGSFEPQTVFESSGTTGTVNSSHYVRDVGLYEESFRKGFEACYGKISDWCIIGLLPSYLERQQSSLVYMVDKFITWSGHPQSGFYLDEHEKLAGVIREMEKQKQKTLLIGVTFALLDLAEKFALPLQHTVIMETGGMKGRREEMVRDEVHALLQKSFGQRAIHSEYGMTELLSQAYSAGEGRFSCPAWMKVLVRDEEDPLLVKSSGAGAVNIIDLANIHSCSFIPTDDAGRLYNDGSFEVLGRIDGSDLRGCSLLVV